jgi:hypothetical protein
MLAVGPPSLMTPVTSLLSRMSSIDESIFEQLWIVAALNGSVLQ